MHDHEKRILLCNPNLKPASFLSFRSNNTATIRYGAEKRVAPYFSSDSSLPELLEGKKVSSSVCRAGVRPQKKKREKEKKPKLPKGFPLDYVIH